MNKIKNSYCPKKRVWSFRIFIKNKKKTVSIEELVLNVWAYEESPIASQLLELILKILENI